MKRISTILKVLILAVSFTAFGKVQTTNKTSERIYLLSEQNFKLSQSRIQFETVESSNDFRLVRMDASQVGKLSAHLHREKNICGGYIDVTEEFARSKKDVKTFLREQSLIPLAEFDKSEPTYPDRVKAALTKFNKDRYWSFFKELTSFPNRSATTEDGKKAAKWLGEQALKIAAKSERTDVTVRYFETGGSYVQPSTLVRIPGKDPSLPAVLVGGHMDTNSGDKPGADDDGSGTSTVMEVYTSILDSGLKFDRDIYFAFYAAEERGLVGSGVMATKMLSEGTKIRGALQFDMTGFKSPRDSHDIYFINDNVDSNMTTFMKKLAIDYLAIPANKIGDDECGYACSDHAQWQRRGVPAAFPFESSFDNYNKAIHSSEDKIDLLDIEHSAQFAKLGIAFVVETADPVQE